MTRSWEWLTLDDVLTPQLNRKKVQQGWSPKCHDFPAAPGEWGVLKTTAIQAGRFEPEHNKALPDHLDPKPGIEVGAGDLLMTCAGPRSRCGVPALVRTTSERLMMSGKMYRFRPDDRVDSRFLELWLLSPEAQSQIDAMKTGISDSGLNLTHSRFTRLPVPVPPLDEQLRIVDLLEDHLSRLDAAESYLSAARRQLVTLERSALDVQFGGEDIALADLIKDISAGKSFGAANAPARRDEWGIIKVSAMTWGEFDPAENKAVTDEERVDPRFEIHSGDLLVSRANTSELVGASVLVRDVRPKLLLSDKSLRVTPRSEVGAEWLWRALQAPSARRQISALATGTKDSMRNISQAALKRILLPKVNREEQADALKSFGEVADAVAVLGSEIETGTKRLKALRRSLLSAASSGDLTGAESDLSEAEEMIGA